MSRSMPFVYFWSRVRLAPELGIEKFTDATGRERYRLTAAATR